MAVAVIAASGKKLMPTNNAKARKLLKSGRAVIYKYRPVFTIQLLDRTDGEVQPVEYKCDTGYAHIGISVCSGKHEYVNAQYDLLKDETERHNDCRKYRGVRRSHKTRYRKPRFDNRHGLICKDGFAPSVRNKRDRHIDLFEQYYGVLPVTSAVFEMGQFDTQLLKAVEEGKPLPQGEDYQHGERYGTATIREAVFTRDGYKCIICGRTPFKDHAILHVHHTGFWKGDHTNRMANLATVCEKCHTTGNHKPGGKLFGLEPKLKSFRGATFMTMVRFDMFRRLKETAPDVAFHMTYGAATKLARHSLGVKKTHSNDAYCMGEFHPKHRADFRHFVKCRRNNRVLSKFYDAKYTDLRDGSIKKGTQIGCNRTKRSVPRNNDQNERMYRGHKVSRGRYAIRKQRLPLRPGDTVFRLDTHMVDHVKGARANGNIELRSGKGLSIKKLRLVKHTGGRMEVTT